MKKSHIAMLAVFFLAIPLTIYLGSFLPGRNYYLTGTLIIFELMVPFFMAFEGRKPQARELVVLAVMCAIAIVGRVAIPLDNFKAIFAIIMLTGIAFGPESGFIVGAIAAFASNFFYGHGAHTPWQMFAYGAGGMLAGFCFARGRLPRKRWVLAIFGFFAVILFVGPLLDCSYIFLALSTVNWKSVGSVLLSGFYVNLTQAICTVLVMLLFGPALLNELERIQTKYGMMEGNHGL